MPGVKREPPRSGERLLTKKTVSCFNCAHERKNQTCALMLYGEPGKVNRCKGFELLTPGPKSDIIDKRQRVFLMVLRQVLIMLLGGLEDLLELKRSIAKRKR